MPAAASGRRQRFCHLSAPEMEALYSAGLTAQDVHLYVYLRWHRNRQTGLAFPSRMTIARELGLREHTVSSRLKRIEGLGLVVCFRSNGRHNSYAFPLATGDGDSTGYVSCTGVVHAAEPVRSTSQTGTVDVPLTALQHTEEQNAADSTSANGAYGSASPDKGELEAAAGGDLRIDLTVMRQALELCAREGRPLGDMRQVYEDLLATVCERRRDAEHGDGRTAERVNADAQETSRTPSC